MLLAPLFTLLYFLHLPIFAFADDNIADYKYGFAGPNPMCPPQSFTFLPPKLWKLILFFGVGNTIATCLIIGITTLNILVYKLRKLQEANFEEKESIPSASSSSSLPSSSEQLSRRFSLSEIHLATENFNDALVIGQGGFGKVYKGVIDNGAHTVAIKRLNRLSKQGAIEFWTEIEMLSKFRHSHLVSMIGYCDNSHEMILVYKYMVRGTLADHLYKNDKNGNPHLSWVQRLKICIGAARGLDYLHTGTGTQDRVIHRDVKSSNILLDEKWAAKISDFGLSKVGPANQTFTHVSTSIKGTYGYLDPEYFLTHRLTRKSDVYAFGVVLFEVLCGRPALDFGLDEEQWGLAGWAQHCIKESKLHEIIDPSLRWEILQNSLMAFVEIAEACLHKIPKKRPTMADVMVRLESALALQEGKDISMVGEDIFNIARAYDILENADTSMAEGEIINIGGTCDNRENVDSSTKQEVVNTDNGRHHDEHINGNVHLGDASGGPGWVSFTRKVRMFFHGTSRVTTVHSDAKPSKRNKRNNNSGSKSALPKKDVGVVQEVSENKSNNNSASNSAWPKKDGDVIQEVSGTGQTGIPSLMRFTIAELKAATKNFKTDKELGSGRFGIVFKGWVDEKTYSPFNISIRMAIAVKKLKSDRSQGRKELQAEVEFLGNIAHPNLVKLWGYCMEGSEFLLVYEYINNGSLESRLFSRSAEPLPWVTRLKISIGAARGLAFLHTAKKQVIYRSFSASNILLDGDFNAKLSDFGLAILASTEDDDDDFYYTKVGPPPNSYAAPETVLAGHLSMKSDVYSFGVVLLEILTGMRVYDKLRPTTKRNLINWARPILISKRKVKTILDPRLEQDHQNIGAFLSVVPGLVLKCLEYNPKDRPSMKEVLETLEQINPETPSALD